MSQSFTDGDRPIVDPATAIPKPLTPAKPTPTDTEKYYFLTVTGASMHRSDGVLIPFQFNFYATSDLYDQRYLDEEISLKHPYLRYANDMEITAYKMRNQTPEQLREQIKEEMIRDAKFAEVKLSESEEETRAKLKASIMEELSREGRIRDVSAYPADSLTPGPRLGGIVSSANIPQGAQGPAAGGLSSGIGSIVKN